MVAIGADADRQQIGVGTFEFGGGDGNLVDVIGLDSGRLDGQREGLRGRGAGRRIEGCDLELGLLLLRSLRERRDEFKRARLARLESSGRKRGGRKLCEQRGGAGEIRRDILEFLIAAVHQIHAYPDPFAAFKD